MNELGNRPSHAIRRYMERSLDRRIELLNCCFLSQENARSGFYHRFLILCFGIDR